MEGGSGLLSLSNSCNQVVHSSLSKWEKKKVKRGERIAVTAEALLKFNPEESVFSNYSNLANCISIVCVFFCARCCCLLNALKLASEGD